MKNFTHVFLYIFLCFVFSSCIVDKENVCKEGAKVCEVGSPYDPNLREKADLTLTMAAGIDLNDSFLVKGTCSPLSSKTVIDLDGDGVATPGFSNDLFECDCLSSGLSCPAVTIDHAQLGKDSFSISATLTSPYQIKADAALLTPIQLMKLVLGHASQIDDNDNLVLSASCLPNGAKVKFDTPNGFSPATQECDCSGGALSNCVNPTESNALLNQNLSVKGTLTWNGVSITNTKSTRVYNGPPAAASAQTGLGHSYKNTQLGGLSFIRFGNRPGSSPTNDVGHRELSDFVDDPFGHADGKRSDNSDVLRDYVSTHNTNDHQAIGWAISSTIDKYSNAQNEITPVSGAAVSGDVYRGYFVPPADGIYTFQNTSQPDNSVRVLMSVNECAKDIVALISADWANGGFGATHSSSLWIQGDAGQYQNAWGKTNNVFLHDTSAFFPGGTAHAEYSHGDAYLLANQIYYLEIRYAEGGGQQSFAFGVQRRDLDGQNPTTVSNLKASSMLPYSGTDAYVSRQICAGTTYEASRLFTDPESDTLTYEAYLVTSGGVKINGPEGLLSHIGLSLNTNTGAVTGTLNGNYTSQQIVFRAIDTQGNNAWVESPPIRIIGN